MSMPLSVLAPNRALLLSMNRQPGIAKAIVLWFALSLLAGCQSVPAIEGEDLIGIWVSRVGGAYIQFNADGTFNVASTVDGLTSQGHDYGDFRLEGTALMLITDEESPFCAGQTGHYQVEISEEGKIETTLVDDPCSDRSTSLRSGTLSPYSP